MHMIEVIFACDIASCIVIFVFYGFYSNANLSVWKATNLTWIVGFSSTVSGTNDHIP